MYVHIYTLQRRIVFQPASTILLALIYFYKRYLFLWINSLPVKIVFVFLRFVTIRKILILEQSIHLSFDLTILTMVLDLPLRFEVRPYLQVDVELFEYR